LKEIDEQDRLAALAADGGQTQGTTKALASVAPAAAELALATRRALEQGVRLELAELHQSASEASEVLGSAHHAGLSPVGRVSFRR
jgi:hypothetical protein